MKFTLSDDTTPTVVARLVVDNNGDLHLLLNGISVLFIAQTGIVTREALSSRELDDLAATGIVVADGRMEIT